MDVEIEIKQAESSSDQYAVSLTVAGVVVRELAPLSQPIAQHVADCLRIKVALDAGTPLEVVSLSRPMHDLAGAMEDLRGESLEAIMDAMIAAAAEEPDDPDSPEGAADSQQAGSAASADGGSAAAGAGADSAVTAEPGGGRAEADLEQPAPRILVKQEASSDQTAVHERGGPHAPAAPQCKGTRPELQPEPGLAVQRPAEAVAAAAEEQPAGAVAATAGEQPAEAVAVATMKQPAGAVAAAAGEQPAEAVAVATMKQPAGAVAAAAEEQPAGAVAATAGKQPAEAVAAATTEQPAEAVAAATNEQQQKQRRKPGRRKQVQPQQQPSKQGGAQPTPPWDSKKRDELLARRLQEQLTAAERYRSRQRRTAAPAEGSLRDMYGRTFPQAAVIGADRGLPSRRQAPSAAAAGGPEGGGEGNGEAGDSVEFQGVARVGGGEEARWRATMVAMLDAKQEAPVVGGTRWAGTLCECGSQAEAGVARDLALLWREQRLGFLSGDLSWVPEEYNFQLEGYHKLIDVTPGLLRCRTLTQLKSYLETLDSNGRLARMAATLRRNRFSVAAAQPPPEPAVQAKVGPQYHRVSFVRAEGRLPWRTTLMLDQKAKVVLQSATRAQAAAAADMALIWREATHKADGDVEGQQYSFPLDSYREDGEVWGRLLAADHEGDLRVLFRKLRGCGWLEHFTRQQLEQRRQQEQREEQAQARQQRQEQRQQQAQQRQQQRQQQAQQRQEQRQQRQQRGAVQHVPAAAPPAKRQKVVGGGTAGATAAVERPRNAAAARSAAAAEAEAPAAASAGPGPMRRGRHRKAEVLEPKREPLPATPLPPPLAAAPPVAASPGSVVGGGEDPSDPVPLLVALTEASRTAAGRQAGLSVELAATFMPAVQALGAAAQRQQLACLRMLLGAGELGGVVAMLRAAIKIARLD